MMTDLLTLLASTDASIADAWWRTLGRMHPALVHFPVALLVLAAVVELFQLMIHRDRPNRFALTCACIGAVFAAIAATSGWLTAAFEPEWITVSGEEADDLTWHRWIGIGVASIALLGVCFLIAWPAAKRLWVLAAYRICLLLSGVAVATGGWMGGELVFGDGYLFAPLRQAAKDASESTPETHAEVTQNETSVSPPTTDDPPPDSGAIDPTTAPSEAAPGPVDTFTTSVLPILQDRCQECHGPEKQKGKLQLVPMASIFDQPDQHVIVAGDPAASELIERISLPADDIDRMPPKGDRLTPEQIEAITLWIQGGAAVPATKE